MRDKKIGEVHILLQIPKQIDNLRLDRHIKRGNRLIADDELRFDGKCPGDTDSLPLSAGEFMRKTACMLTI